MIKERLKQAVSDLAQHNKDNLKAIYYNGKDIKEKEIREAGFDIVIVDSSINGTNFKYASVDSSRSPTYVSLSHGGYYD